MTVNCPVCGTPGEAGCFCEMGCGRLPEATKPAATTAANVPPARCGRPRLNAVLPSFFLQDVAELVVFNYGFDADVVTSATVRVLCGKEVVATETANGRPDRTGKLRVNLLFAQAGRLALTVEFAFRRENECEDDVLQVPFTVEVKPRMSSLNINYEPSITLSGNYGTDLAGARVGNLELPKEVFQTERPVPVFQTFELEWMRTAGRLLLVASERIVQLLARTQVTVGRNRDNDVVLRAFGSDASTRDDVSVRLSGTHFRCEIDAAGCTLVDGNGTRPSTNGTHVEGVALPPGGSKFVRNGSVAIGFGPGTEDFELDLTVCTDAYGHVRGCRLTRTDAAQRQTVVLLPNGEVPLDSVRERIAWDGCLFSCVTERGERVALVPGAEVELGGHRWQVVPFGLSYIHRYGCE